MTNEAANVDSTTGSSTPTSSGLTDDQKAAIEKAKGSVSKKVLWWVLGIFGVVLIVIFVLIFVLRKGGPGAAIQQVMDKTKKEVSAADLEAKVAAAEAAKVDKENIEEIKKLLEIDDVDERRKKLAELLE